MLRVAANSRSGRLTGSAAEDQAKVNYSSVIEVVYFGLYYQTVVSADGGGPSSGYQQLTGECLVYLGSSYGPSEEFRLRGRRDWSHMFRQLTGWGSHSLIGSHLPYRNPITASRSVLAAISFPQSSRRRRHDWWVESLRNLRSGRR
jgi:hypothetical protein